MNPYLCVDCGVDTDVIDEYYMVYDNVWPIGAHDGQLCIGCLERRIGRQLNANDFPPDIPINEGFFPRSERFLNRLNKEATHEEVY